MTEMWPEYIKEPVVMGGACHKGLFFFFFEKMTFDILQGFAETETSQTDLQFPGLITVSQRYM